MITVITKEYPMKNSDNVPELEVQATTLDNQYEDRRYHTQQETIRQAGEAETVARSQAEGFEQVAADLHTFSESQAQTLDPRGEIPLPDINPQHSTNDHLADSIFVGTVLAAHLAQQVGQHWQQQQEQHIEEILRDQEIDPQYQAENTVLEQIVQDDLKKQVSWHAPEISEMVETSYGNGMYEQSQDGYRVNSLDESCQVEQNCTLDQGND
jgi:hypothetical protein